MEHENTETGNGAHQRPRVRTTSRIRQLLPLGMPVASGAAAVAFPRHRAGAENVLGLYLASLAAIGITHQIFREFYRDRRTSKEIGRAVWLEHLAVALMAVDTWLLLARPFPDPWLAVTVAVTLVAATALYGGLLTRLKDKLRTAHRPTLTERARRWWIVGNFIESARSENCNPLTRMVGQTADRLTRPAGKEGPSPLGGRVLSGLVTIALALSSSTAAAVVADHRNATPIRGQRDTGGTGPSAGSPPEHPLPSPAPGTPKIRNKNVTFVDLCGLAAVEPGAGAGWASQGLWDLWFRPGKGAGAGQAGCPRPPAIAADLDDTVVYQASYEGTQLVAVAVNSRLHGAALLYGEVGTWVLGQLEAGRVVSGTPRHDVGNGDIYLIFTENGTMVFMRDQKHVPDDPTDPTPYQLLSPPATVLWMDEMRHWGRWLWAVQNSLGGSDGQSFDLSEEPGVLPTVAVFESPSSSAAACEGLTVTAAQAAQAVIDWPAIEHLAAAA